MEGWLGFAGGAIGGLVAFTGSYLIILSDRKRIDQISGAIDSFRSDYYNNKKKEEGRIIAEREIQIDHTYNIMMMQLQSSLDDCVNFHQDLSDYLVDKNTEIEFIKISRPYFFDSPAFNLLTEEMSDNIIELIKIFDRAMEIYSQLKDAATDREKDDLASEADTIFDELEQHALDIMEKMETRRAQNRTEKHADAN